MAEAAENVAELPRQKQQRTLQEKVAAAMGEIGAVEHDANNTYQNYSYTSAAAVLAKAQRALSKQGVAISSKIDIIDNERLQTKGQGSKQSITVMCTVTLSDGSGETLTASAPGCGMDNGDKAPMKATTAAYKYALATALCIGLGSDPEADSSTDSDPVQQPQQQRSGNGRQNGGGQRQQQQGQALGSGEGPDYIVPAGSQKGHRLGDVPDAWLEQMIEYVSKDSNPSERNQRMMERCQEELLRRYPGTHGQPPHSGQGGDDVPF
jgi:hypothetical protein